MADLTEAQKAQFRKNHRRRWADPEYRKKVREQNRQWSKNNPASSRKRSLAWRRRNLKKARTREREWRKKNRVYTQARDHNRRAKKLAVTVNPRSILIFISGVRALRSVKCYYCQKPVPGKYAHIDHIIPLSKGGPHSVENLCVACPPCNQSKLNKRLADFVTLGQQLLEL